MTCPSLLVTDAKAAIDWLAKTRLESPHRQHTFDRALQLIRILIDQHQRSEELMKDIGKVIQFERQRAEAAEAKVTTLTAERDAAVAAAPDADDQAEIDKGLAEIAAATPPAPPA